MEIVDRRLEFWDQVQGHGTGSPGCQAEEESLGALDDCVRAGKVRYIACPNFYAWQVCEGLWE